MTATLQASARFSVGSLLARSFGLLLGQFRPFLLVAAVMFVPYLVLVLHAGGDPVMLEESLLTPPVVAQLAFGLLMDTLAAGLLAHAVYQGLGGRAISLQAALSAACRHLVPLVILSLLLGAAVVIGLVLLVIPGLILWSAGYVVMPACVLEDAGPWRSLERSFELTRGHRWSLCAILLVMLIVAIGGSYTILELEGTIDTIGATLLSYAWQVLVSTFIAVSSAVAYHDLRVVKEGADAGQIAAIFA